MCGGIQAIVARELDGEPMQWTVGTTYTNREPSMATLSTSYDLLKDISVLQWDPFCAPPSLQLCKNMLHQEWALCWGISKILLEVQLNPHRHSLYLQLHWYVPISSPYVSPANHQIVQCCAILMGDWCLEEHSVFCLQLLESI